MFGVIFERLVVHRTAKRHRQKTTEVGIDQRRNAARQQQAGTAAELARPPVGDQVVEPRHRDQHPDRKSPIPHRVAKPHQAVETARQAYPGNTAGIGKEGLQTTPPVPRSPRRG